MATTDLGKVSVTPKGAWSSGATYEALDIVSDSGSSYLALQSVAAGTALSNTTYWMKIAAKGNTGNGIVSIAKTGTSGLVDTYTITYDSGDPTTFTITNGEDGEMTATSVAPEYSTSATYAVGDYVTYDGQLYVCTTAISTAESWTSGHWTAAAIAPVVSDLKSATNAKLNGVASFAGQDHITANSFVQGSINRSGLIQDENIRCCWNKAVYLHAGDVISGVNNVVGLQYGIINASSTYDSSWRSGTYNFTVTVDDWYFVQVRKSDNSAITPSDITDLSVTFYDHSSTAAMTASELSFNLGTLSNGYIEFRNGNFASANSYRATDFLPIKAKNIKFSAWFSGDAGIAFYTSAKVYISGVGLGTATRGDILTAAVPSDAYYLRYCFVAANESGAFVQLIDVPEAIAIDRETSFDPCTYKGTSARAFKKILCIGDSLTEGIFDYYEGGVRKYQTSPEYSYPTYLKAITGRDTTNKGDGGQSTKSWYTAHSSDDLSGHDACIIELGLNDYAGAAAVQCSSAERLAALGNIISKVKSENTGIKIFISTLLNVYTGTDADAVNADIRDIAANTADVYLVDVSEYGTLTISGPDRFGHLTAIGYMKLAQYYNNYISYIIDTANEETFRFIQYIGTNHTHDG